MFTHSIALLKCVTLIIYVALLYIYIKKSYAVCLFFLIPALIAFFSWVSAGNFRSAKFEQILCGL